MNYFELHLGDMAKATAHLSILEDGCLQRLLRRYYDEEAPLPADVRTVQRLIGARSKEEREATLLILDEHFELLDDGWHNARCDAEIAAFRAKQADRQDARESAKTRQRRARERRKELFAQLKSHGLVPPWTTVTADLEAMLSRVTGASGHGVVTATQTPDTNLQSPGSKEEGSRVASPAIAREPETDPVEANGHEPTKAGKITRAMRAKGLASCNPGDPRLLELIAQGATLAEFEGAAEEAVARKKGFAYALAMLEGRRKEAAEIALAPAAPAADPKAWSLSKPGVFRMAAGLGVPEWDEVDAYNGRCPPWPRYVASVVEAWEKAGRPVAVVS